MPSDSSRNPLPFEPKKNPKKSAAGDTSKSETPTSEKSPKKVERRSSGSANQTEKGKRKQQTSSSARSNIPEVVSRRMITRMGLFSGVPTVLGMGSLVGSYFVVTREWFPLPNVAALLVSMGFFGLGVLGLSYGVFSASWDEREDGSKLGWSEFKTNIGRVYQDWKTSRQKK
ncbi:MAG: PAM68 family protein [Cyanobacteriota bacterium]|nr:PAM68 family protein [Cyanobacteriota bacterium]